MKLGISVGELAQKLASERQRKVDYLVNTKKMQFDNDRILFTSDNVQHAVELCERAHTQLAAWADIPARYYRKMRVNEPELLAENVNTWFQNNSADRMIRTLMPEVKARAFEGGDYSNVQQIIPTNKSIGRAFLSNRYRRIDNWDVANAVLPVLQGIDGCLIASCELTEQRMYIKARFTKTTGDVQVGDTVESGVVISNSEVGMGAVVVQPFIHRLVCTNGMVVNAATRRNHIGAAAKVTGENYEFYSDKTIELDDAAVLAKVADSVRAAADETLFMEHTLPMLQAAVGTPRVAKPVKAVQVLAQKLGLREEEGDTVLEHLLRDGDLSQWGMANAVTRTAEDMPTYDRATELESLGHKVITMDGREWGSIVKAA